MKLAVYKMRDEIGLELYTVHSLCLSMTKSRIASSRIDGQKLADYWHRILSSKVKSTFALVGRRESLQKCHGMAQVD